MDQSWKTRAAEEIKSYPVIYLLLGITLIFCFVLRIYRIDQLMWFYYDQGRDALAIWNLWHSHKFFLIGPVTGFDGIFLGPAYYYIIALFYKLGNGSPLYPSVFLSFTTTIAALIVFLLGKKFHSREAGLFASVIFSFSYFLVLASRWLSNPTMIIITSVIFIWVLYEITQGKKRFWPLATLVLGLSLQFEAASAVYYLLAFLFFTIWQRKNWPGLKLSLLSALVFLLTFVPQVLFDIRHGGIIHSSIERELFTQKAFRASFWQVVLVRLNLYYNVFSQKLVPFRDEVNSVALLMVALMYVIYRKVIINKGVIVTSILLGSVLVGYLFFQGNLGRIYDYYFTGFYLPFVLLFSIGLAQLYKHSIFTKAAVIIFFIAFFVVNSRIVIALNSRVDESDHVSLGNELQAVDWVLNDSKNREFNVDVYVPPVIPYSYDYLFLWQANKKCGDSLCNMKKDQVSLLYTLFEVDPPHPERLEEWLKRQENIGKVEEEIRFGGITVQKRSRVMEE